MGQPNKNGGQHHIKKKKPQILNISLETIKLLEENIDSKPLIFVLAMFFGGGREEVGIWHQKQRQWKQKYTSETTSNEKASSQQRKPSMKQKGNLMNGRQYL